MSVCRTRSCWPTITWPISASMARAFSLNSSALMLGRAGSGPAGAAGSGIWVLPCWVAGRGRGGGEPVEIGEDRVEVTGPELLVTGRRADETARAHAAAQEACVAPASRADVERALLIALRPPCG